MEAADWIERLSLRANPEGGYYRESHREAFPGDPSAPLVTVIDYLLTADSPRSRLHATAGASIHYHLAGGALRIHAVDPGGRYSAQRLGPPLALQVVVAAGAWKAIELCEGPWALIAEAVVPGWTLAGHRSATPALREALAPELWPILAPFIAGAEADADADRGGEGST